MAPFLFIAKKFHSSKAQKIRYSRPIIRIATIGVGIGIVVMLLSIAISKGFKSEISNNVAAANAHFKVLPIAFRDNPELLATFPQQLQQKISSLPFVNSCQGTLYQPVLLESGGNIYGLLLKGVEKTVPEQFQNRFLKSGTMPSNDATAKEICLSKAIAAKLKLSVGDKVNVYITRGSATIKKRKFSISGIFNTGIPGIDEDIAYASIKELQSLSNEVPQIFVRPQESGILLESNLSIAFDLLLPEAKQNIRKIVPETGVTYSVTQKYGTLSDTLTFTIANDGTINIVYDAKPEYTALQALEIYTTGFEAMEQREEAIFETLPYDYELTNVKKDNPEVFNWLNLLDTNVVVLLAIMAIVSLVNMASALLVLIVEKTTAIALLKTMGGSNGLIKKVFLSIAGFILFRGLVFGNLLFLTAYFLQRNYHFFTLDESQYYLSFVPLEISFQDWAITNLGTMVFCLIVLILPTILITRIYPAKALRFQ